MSTIQAERAVGWSAITGTGLVAMKIGMYAYRSLRGDDKVEDEISDCTTEVPKDVIATPLRRTTSSSIFGIFRRTLRRILLDESEFIARAPRTIPKEDIDDDDDESATGPLVTHQGSCHCESIQFTVLAPSVLTAHDGPGKIQFRHTQVRASNFRIYAGYENLKTYYVVYRDSGKKGAHAFCERCGVHVLYAPSKTTPYLSINVRCLRADEGRKIKLKSKKESISDGIPLAGQFDYVNSDHLSTISEVTQPFHFQMNYVNPNPTNYHFTHRKHDARRTLSDVSSLASSIASEEGAIEVPIKQFYATTNGKKIRKLQHPPRPMTPTTSSLTTTGEGDSSLYKEQRNDLPPLSPPRSGGASFGGIDDFSFAGVESVSLMGDNLSVATTPKSPTISIREKKLALRVSTGGIPGENPPRHPTVTSPETRSKMKYFMSKYKKTQAANSGGNSSTD